METSFGTSRKIPVLTVARGAEPAIAALNAEPARLANLIASARRMYTTPGMHLADRLSLLWSRRALTPYGAAVETVSQAMARGGAYLLNYSYEWGCTSGGVADPALGGMTLLRTLDWPFDGLGDNLVVTRCDGGAGAYLNVAWPGYVGVLTALAPGRFAASINQPPLPKTLLGAVTGWPLARFKVARSHAIPADHLLRLAFDTCRSFDEAVALIRSTPICLPAIFTLVGPEAGQAITIERSQTEAFIPSAPAAANHWAADGGPAGRPRDNTSLQRRAEMLALLQQAPDWSLGWLRAPLLQPITRLAFMANPATGKFALQGFEKYGAATELLAA